MAADPGSRKRLRRDSMDGSLRGTPSTSKDRRTKRPVKPIKERWLLTRKTWRYMADAGRRLIPEGTHNRPEDLPRIEQTFQEVCQKEPRFLLWRKSSYPGSLTFRAHRRRRQIGKDGSYRAHCQASSADEADDVRNSPQSFNVHATTAGKFDLTKAKREPLLFSGGSGSGSTPSSPEACRKISQENVEEDDLVHMLQTYLFVGNSSDELAIRSNLPSEQPVERPKTIQTGSSLDHRSLVNKLQRYVDRLVDEAKERSSGQSCTGEKGRAALSSSSHGHVVRQQLVETLNRYYGKFSSRDHVISDILTDRKLLEKLYFDLRYSRKFRMPRCASSWWLDTGSRESAKKEVDLSSFVYQLPENYSCQIGVQTNPVSRDALDACLLEKEKEQSSRRRSSVDDVSPSVGDTIKRYLRMARKKSIDADKDDRFKRVNYDRLLLAKRKGAELKISDDSGNSKGCQTEDDWAVHYREMFFPTSECPSENLSDIDVTTSPPSRNASSRSSIDAGSEEVFVHVKYPHQSFLSHLLHVSNAHKDKPHSAPGSPALTSSTANSTGGTAMQKSKSSSSVVHHGSRLVAKKIWRSRSKSISRTSHQPFVWTPQGKCTWAGTGGRRVTLQDVSLRSLSEIERKVLCKVAVAKLQALNLGVHIRPPNESLGSGLVTTKPKKRAYLLKRKALTTSFFDNKEKDAPVGLVFGIPLSQCLENDRIARIAAGEVTDVGTLSKSSRHGSRTSFSSLTETSMTTAKTEEKGSNESLSSKGTPTLGGDSGMVELSDSGGSTGSEWDTVPNIVRQCIWHLENTGFQTLGVFRVSSSKKRVRELRENFDCGRETKIGLDQCPHDVATLLKEYFRDLPDPLLCRELYQAFVHTQKIRNRRLQQEALQHLIQLLPTANRDTLWTLLTFLNDVAKYSQDYKTENGEWLPGNKMDKTNLATVFAPNILHCVKPGQVRSEISSERAEERMDVINVMRTLLEHTSSLFTVPAALLDEVYQHMMDTHPAELDIALSRRIEDQSEDEVDLYSEAETVEETLTMSSTMATKETSTRKIWTREQCLHQAAGIGGDIEPRPRRSKRLGGRRKEDGRSDSVDSGSSEDPSDTRRRSSSTVITASLTIPMSDAFSLSLDIPYIEETPKQSSVVLKQRQRSISGYREAGRHGSDSNISSLATQSSDHPPSSPPSWTSSSPTSPDSSGNTISHIPDQQAILQKVSFTISSEVKQVNRSDNQREARKSTPYTPSITNIGGAVMRSKTADIERMLKISGSTVEPVTQQMIRNPSTTLSDSKKYTKRRYTDSRHPTRHIPDSNSLTSKIVSAPSTTLSSSTTTQNQRSVPLQSVWKRRELISSTPDDK